MWSLGFVLCYFNLQTCCGIYWICDMNLKPVLKICLGCEHKTTFRFRALNVSFQNKSMVSRWIPSVKLFTSNYGLTISCSRNWISLEQATFF